MNEEMKARLIKLVADQAGCPSEIVKPDSKLVADLGMDSHDLIETCMAVEAEFEIEIDDEEIVETGIRCRDMIRLVYTIETSVDT